MLEPKGPGAARIEVLWWPMLWISTVVFVVVCAMLLWAILRGRRSTDELDHSEVSWGDRFVVISGVIIPALILVGVFVFSLREMRNLALADDDAELEIEVIGRDWWWEVRYPNGAVTANEIHIPVGEPVRLKLNSADVIHSFWVPELQAKTDMIPGTETTTWLHADEPGRYRGQCAEFCGLQHSKMAFYVVAEERDAFEEWVDHEAEPMATQLTRTILFSEGQDIFLNSSCVGCHAIRGTEATATDGPDLTHLMNRDIIGGFFGNTPQNLRQFVRNPHALKRGVFMPPADLDDDELDALIEYLGNLD
ncbi:MAG: cytochrome c oxidase subunit II [Actinomycetota bacterium]